ncbi:DUF1134 domain-containing protein [Pararhizobium mangrovi]|uniref:DUF1134 domain-containing protein n=1 Tax=Pararhizobium mangrovi TaxID=2590452 RepID=A0A506UHK9_9HYPH|nr:DUF1134 domain-containing protein [Pararhizobium mangrovi]TPW32788.1 DUF1134 domain-containing protein [Pararhizobium mangrovi]
MRLTCSAFRSTSIAAFATLALACSAAAPANAQEPVNFGSQNAGSGAPAGGYANQGAYGSQGSYDGQGTYDGQAPTGEYSPQEIVDAGNTFFGRTSQGLAKLLERAFDRYGQPNGYILGQEASGAFIGGLTYGEGELYTKNAGSRTLFWQGPHVGVDYGGSGSRIMVLVYNLPAVNSVFGRFAGVSGSAYLVAGLGMNVLAHDRVIMVPIRTGVGAHLGINVGYLKVTPTPTWNPF